MYVYIYIYIFMLHFYVLLQTLIIMEQTVEKTLNFAKICFTTETNHSQILNVLGCFVLELLRFRTHLFYCQAFLPALIKTERTIAKTNKLWISNFSYFNKPEPKFQYLSLLCSIRLKISLYINVVFKNGPCSNFSSPKNSWN